MAARSSLGCLAIAAIACACGGRDEDKTDPPAAQPTGVDIDKRCVQLGKLCGDTSKHVDKIADDCRQALKNTGCADKTMAAYDCFERDLCTKKDKVWAVEDFGVLAERHGKCVAERTAARDCAANRKP